MGALNIILLAIVAISIPGLINRTRSIFAGRKGPRLTQHLSDVRLLLRKGAVYSTTTSVLFRAVPSVYLGSAIVAALFIPIGTHSALLGFQGDIVLFAYLLALGRFALILGAMDTAGPFEGMGASREALYGALVEPAIMMAFGTLALITRETSFSQIFEQSVTLEANMAIVLLLTTYVVINVLYIEGGRVPIDDTHTHLELTMIHEAMCLDYCGVDLAMIKIAGWIKSASISLIAANALTSMVDIHWLWCVPIAICLAGFSIGFIESTRARNKLLRNSTYILTVVALAALAMFTAYLLQHNIQIR